MRLILNRMRNLVQSSNSVSTLACYIYESARTRLGIEGKLQLVDMLSIV